MISLAMEATMFSFAEYSEVLTQYDTGNADGVSAGHQKNYGLATRRQMSATMP
jgi:hypothetical protein